MSKIELPTVTSGYNLSTINNNFQKIEDTLNKEVLYRKGYLGEPNEMQTNLDMNGNQILNVTTGTSDGSLVTKGHVDQGLALKFDKSGGPISGSVDMNSNEILNVSKLSTNTLEIGGVPVVPTDLAIYYYNETREALRRSYAEAGYNLVDGSFEVGGTLVNANDVLLQESTGKAFAGPAGTVAAGTNPASGGFVDKSEGLLRHELATSDGAAKVGNANGGSVQDFIDETGLYIPKPTIKKTVIADTRYGVSPTNTAAANGAIITTLLEQYKEVVIAEDIPLEGVVIKNIFNKLRGLGFITASIQTSGASCISLIRGAINCSLIGMVITCYAENSTAIDINGDIGTGSQPQYLNFYDVYTEGGKTATECWEGTTSLKIKNSWSNNFYSCRFNRTKDGVIFGESGGAANSVNANYFYGCEVRSVNTYTNGGSPVIHYVGDGNAFIGGIIENWKQRISVHAGDLTITSGAYIEAFADACTASLYGGTLKVTECYRPGFVFVHATDAKLIYKNNNNENMPAINYNYPLVQILGDFNPVIEIEQSGVGSTVFRYGEYNNGSTWAVSTFKNLRQNVKFYNSSFGLHCTNDQSNVTGDGTPYTVIYSSSVGNNAASTYFDNASETTPNNGLFTAKQGGIYDFSGSLYLGGLTDGMLVSLNLIVGGVDYSLGSKKYTTSELSTGQLILNWSKKAKMLVNQTAFVRLTVSGGAKVVSVLRFDASSGYTTFEGFKAS